MYIVHSKCISPYTQRILSDVFLDFQNWKNFTVTLQDQVFGSYLKIFAIPSNSVVNNMTLYYSSNGSSQVKPFYTESLLLGSLNTLGMGETLYPVQS